MLEFYGALDQLKNVVGERNLRTVAPLADKLTRNMYPIEVLLAVSTIYLDASSNITDLLGTSFKMASSAADELIKKLYNPII